MSTYQAFQDQFHNVLRESDRWSQFIYIAEQLRDLNRPVNIVETGCARQANNWLGDGMSTLLWDWIIGDLGGTATSFDISPLSVAFAREATSRVNVVRIDSVIGLREIDATKIDLLYLDSYDWDGGNLSDPSPIHHLAELASVYAQLPAGCLIAVDDCFGKDGKHKYVAKFLSSRGVEPEMPGRVTVWKKRALS